LLDTHYLTEQPFLALSLLLTLLYHHYTLHIIQAVETALTPWLQGLNPDALLYDKTYGGVITTNGVADLYADYGSGWYSDHHFHYGYFAYAAATLAKLDVPYWEANKIPMETIIRDFCNPDPTDPDFPFARHKDFFDGHSWASGLYPQANGKGQESSSEVRYTLYIIPYLVILTSSYGRLFSQYYLFDIGFLIPSNPYVILDTNSTILLLWRTEFCVSVNNYYS
jgi:Glycosyl hydrolase family 81 C-terminal domain